MGCLSANAVFNSLFTHKCSATLHAATMRTSTLSAAASSSTGSGSSCASIPKRVAWNINHTFELFFFLFDSRWFYRQWRRFQSPKAKRTLNSIASKAELSFKQETAGTNTSFNIACVVFNKDSINSNNVKHSKDKQMVEHNISPERIVWRCVYHVPLHCKRRSYPSRPQSNIALEPKPELSKPHRLHVAYTIAAPTTSSILQVKSSIFTYTMINLHTWSIFIASVQCN